jgi:hypothetical protein
MKKVLCVLFAFIFLSSSTSFTITRDYCLMKNKSTFSFKPEKSCCCKKSNQDNCCKKNQIKIAKIKDNYTAVQKVNIPSIKLTGFVLSFIQTLKLSGDNLSADLISNHAPPPGDPVSRTILYRTILI